MLTAVPSTQTETDTVVIALIGNPNSGKTTLFNALTGLRQKVGNYPGVTVERKEGKIVLPNGKQGRLLDLPGLYSLTPHSPDERIARDVLLGLRDDTPKPDLIINVVDATNLERNLYVTSQLLDMGLPVILAVTMTDMLKKQNKQIDIEKLRNELQIPVWVIIASKREGLDDLLQVMTKNNPIPSPVWKPSQMVEEAIRTIQGRLLEYQSVSERSAFAEAVTLLMTEGDALALKEQSEPVREITQTVQRQLASDGVDAVSEIIEARYRWSSDVCKAASITPQTTVRPLITTNDRVDRVVMHPFWGYLLFLVVMTCVFQAIFTFGEGPATVVQNGVAYVGHLLTRYMPPGDLRSLLDAGVLGGLGTTLSFLPQILLLFFFIGFLEDTGYMARAAFLMDRLMSRVGLHGKSFIPLLSSFACAIPGIMATRTIGDRKARLITILVAPLMSCSARLPVYLLMISAFIPNKRVLGIGHITLLTLPGLTFVSMYFLGMIAAFCMAWLFHKTLLKGVSPTFLMELPPYRLPALRTVVMQMIERAFLFVRRAGTVILASCVLVWCLSSYPKHPGMNSSDALRNSYLGEIGHVIEPAIAPLGFNWKMGVGIASSFVAREVFVSTMGTVYNVGSTDSKIGQANLGKQMRADKDVKTGKPSFNSLIAVCLMIYYVLAMQCVSTIAVVRRETNGWKWPLFQLFYMTGLAWGTTFVVFHVGMYMHWGIG